MGVGSGMSTLWITGFVTLWCCQLYLQFFLLFFFPGCMWLNSFCSMGDKGKQLFYKLHCCFDCIESELEHRIVTMGVQLLYALQLVRHMKIWYHITAASVLLYMLSYFHTNGIKVKPYQCYIIASPVYTWLQCHTNWAASNIVSMKEISPRT